MFATGGATRWDVQSLPALRPISVIFCFIALFSLRCEHFENNKTLVVGGAAIFTLAGLHLIPLPPIAWQAIPGRQELVEIDNLSGMRSVWRTWSIAPLTGGNAMLSLFSPLAVLLLGIQISREELYRLLPIMIVLGAFSGLIGLVQTVSGVDSRLYLYKITNYGIPVGLFANRNHNAAMLAGVFPMLAVYASHIQGPFKNPTGRNLISAGIAIALLPLILISGSRSGLGAAIIGIGCAILLYKPSAPVINRTPQRRRLTTFAFLTLTGFTLLGISFLTFFFSRAESISRLLRPAGSEVGRMEFWNVAFEAFLKFFPWGSGSGSFVEGYRSLEPDHLLSTSYLNHAHNDWLETSMTLGLPGLVFIAVGLTSFAIRAFRVWKPHERVNRSVHFARLGSALLLMLAIVSVTDYPMRTPIMMCSAVIYLLWFTVTISMGAVSTIGRHEMRQSRRDQK